MSLLEEYSLRRCPEIPLVVHTISSGSLLVRRQDNWRDRYVTPWLLVKLDWMENKQRPGSYHVRFMCPVHNCSGRRNDVWMPVSSEDFACDYDEFEAAITTWINTNPNLKAFYDPDSARVAMWQVFCHCFDSYMAQNSSQQLQQLIEQCFDTDLGMKARSEAVVASLQTLRDENTPLYEKWDVYMNPMLRKNLSWLGKLINGE